MFLGLDGFSENVGFCLVPLDPRLRGDDINKVAKRHHNFSLLVFHFSLFHGF